MTGPPDLKRSERRRRQPTVGDGVVTLAPFSLRDWEAHLANEDEDTYRWLDMPRSTRESVMRAIRRWQRSWHTNRRVVAFAIRDARGSLVGGCELRTIAEGVGEISYWIGPRFRRRGHASRAVRLLADFGFRDLELRRIEASADIRNVASRAVLRRAGFAEEGILRSKWTPRNGPRDVAVYAILRPS